MVKTTSGGGSLWVGTPGDSAAQWVFLQQFGGDALPSLECFGWSVGETFGGDGVIREGAVAEDRVLGAGAERAVPGRVELGYVGQLLELGGGVAERLSGGWWWWWWWR